MKRRSGIQFLFFSRGLSRWVKRLISISRRFSFSPRKQMHIIRQYVECLNFCNVRGTFFIPAVLLERYITQLKTIDPQTIEWGIHGLVHTDHSQLEYEQQKLQITAAVKIFDKYHVEFRGFRCPYLRYNDHTQRALRDIGRFKFDSSDSIVWEEVYASDRKYYPWIKSFYKAQVYQEKLAKPYSINQLTEIPVSLPDDDITVDRERLSDEQILEMWSVMLRTCHKNKEVFVLQLHPERFLELKGVLCQLIAQAKSLQPLIWIATLSEVAEWQKNSPAGIWPKPYQGAFCITGDIDAITIKDFFIRLREW